MSLEQDVQRAVAIGGQYRLEMVAPPTLDLTLISRHWSNVDRTRRELFLTVVALLSRSGGSVTLTRDDVMALHEPASIESTLNPETQTVTIRLHKEA